MVQQPKSADQSLWIYSKILPFISGKNKKGTNEHLIQCPFCDEAHTSTHPWNAMRGCYFIYQQKYYCYRCNCTKSGLELYEKLSGREYRELMPEYLSFIKRQGKSGINFSNYLSPSSAGYSVDDEKAKRKEDIFLQIPDSMKNELTERGRQYLENRKIFDSPNLPKYAKFYSAVYNSKFDGKKYEVVVIPWYLDGEVWSYQWRFLDSDIPFPKYGFPKDCGKKIYGIDSISTTFPFIICCEGVFDSLWVKNGIAVGGKSLTEYQRAMLKERFPKHRIVYGFDNDEHGLKAMLKDSVLSDSSSLVFYWKDISGGAKDLNDFAIAGNEQYFFSEENVKSHIFSPLSLKLKLSNPFKT